MDLDFSEDQVMFRNAARDFLSRECPTVLVREIEESEEGHSPELWRKIAELGWLGLTIPEAYDGIGSGFLDLAILCDEMGRAVFPSPYLATVVLGAHTILECGSEEQRQRLLPRIAQGELLLTMALSEPAKRFDPLAIATRAVAEGDHFVVDGVKLFVPNANVADYIVCVARTAPGGTPDEGITLLLVDAHAPGVACTPLKSISEIGHDRQCQVTFDGVRVPREAVLGPVGQGWPTLATVLNQATVAKCAEMVGGALAILEMSVEYAKERVAFGRPIGSFQALQHKMANMLIEIDGAWLLTYQAAWLIEEGFPCARQVAMAKAWTSSAYRKVTAEAIQIHGAYGFCSEVDTTLFYRRAKAAELALGDPRFHRRVVARELGM
ncbi:MAG: acyl-CoA dehydrogenase family protein [Chloroflexota bacterium]|nr:acyl-CoA dehydrogenase family protein [Chloroflexota bacterium]